MGSKQSSTAADEINTKTNENNNENIGIFNISGESLTSGNGINLLEVLTFLVVFGGAFVYIKLPFVYISGLNFLSLFRTNFTTRTIDFWTQEQENLLQGR